MRLNINAYLWSSVGFVSLCFMFSVSLRSLLGLWPLCLGNWCTLMKSQCCLVTTGLLNALPSKLRRLSITGWNVSVPNNYILKPCSCTCIINSLSITHQHPAEGAAVLNLAICIWFILHIHTSEGFHFKPNNLCYVFFFVIVVQQYNGTRRMCYFCITCYYNCCYCLSWKVFATFTFFFYRVKLPL